MKLTAKKALTAIAEMSEEDRAKVLEALGVPADAPGYPTIGGIAMPPDVVLRAPSVSVILDALGRGRPCDRTIWRWLSAGKLRRAVVGSKVSEVRWDDLVAALHGGALEVSPGGVPRGGKTRSPRPDVMDLVRQKGGEVSDRAIAREADCSVATVASYRRSLGIEPYEGR